MFKWDRLLRKNKLPKDIDFMKDEIDDADMDLYSEEEMPGDTLKNEDEFEIVEMEILPNKIICPDCGGVTLEGLEFCDKCGGEI
ncbi:MAG: hypothetical protein GX129_08875 [Clostridiales bacterium]|jgi:hypothetical protein|nr:hypothetical protein [Clostridiales bacterium]